VNTNTNASTNTTGVVAAVVCATTIAAIHHRGRVWADRGSSLSLLLSRYYFITLFTTLLLSLYYFITLSLLLSLFITLSLYYSLSLLLSLYHSLVITLEARVRGSTGVVALVVCTTTLAAIHHRGRVWADRGSSLSYKRL